MFDKPEEKRMLIGRVTEIFPERRSVRIRLDNDPALTKGVVVAIGDLGLQQVLELIKDGQPIDVASNGDEVDIPVDALSLDRITVGIPVSLLCFQTKEKSIALYPCGH